MITMMAADVSTIAKAKLMQIGIEKGFGVKPQLLVQDKKVLLYYSQDQLSAARKAFKDVLDAPEGDVSFNYLPVVTPVLIQTYWRITAVAIGGLFLAGYLTGRKKRK